MAQTVVLWGATYSGVPALVVPSSNGTARFTDVTDTTATAADVAQGKYFYTSAGVRTEGTSTGGGGLVYETGTWTPTEDVADYTITLNGTHTVAPWFYMIADASNTYSDVTKTNYCVMYKNWEQSLGAYFYPSSTSLCYGETRLFYRGSNTTSITYGSSVFSHSYSDPSSASNLYPRYWATESSIRAYTSSSTRYWRAGRTYKWIAVWTPTS